MSSHLILASASARRRDLLRRLGVAFDVVVPSVREHAYPDGARRTSRENATAKHDACRKEWPDSLMIAADTTIEFEGRCIEKPNSLSQARAFFRRFSGNAHTVITAVALGVPGTGPALHVVESQVTFRTLTESDMAAYFAEVDPLDKAGAYDIDQQGHLIIESFSGSRTNIMGLPLETVRPWLAAQHLLGPATRPCP